MVSHLVLTFVIGNVIDVKRGKECGAKRRDTIENEQEVAVYHIYTRYWPCMLFNSCINNSTFNQIGAKICVAKEKEFAGRHTTVNNENRLFA